MSGRILIVDDIPANVRLLEAKLTAEYYEVLTAHDGEAALEVARRELPDLILLDVMMPGMDGFETCRRLKADPTMAHIPVVMVTALDQQSARIEGLEAGADDFLTKPPNDLALFARVKSLLRLKMMIDELRVRNATDAEFGVEAEPSAIEVPFGGKVMVVEDKARFARKVVAALADGCETVVIPEGLEAVARSRIESFDLMIVSLSLVGADGLRLCSQVRSHDATRHLPILLIVDEGDVHRLARGLDLGANDYLMRPLDPHELLARVRTQFRRKAYADRLRSNLSRSLELSIKDGLTGLYNRRYMNGHLQSLVRRAQASGKPLSVLLLDIDHFKAINDTYGHQAGDDVLRAFAALLGENMRGVDTPSRYGGEEFVVVMPETDISYAHAIAERVRSMVSERDFRIAPPPHRINITVSIGVAGLEADDADGDALISRADDALYRAKRQGRNRVVQTAA